MEQFSAKLFGISLGAFLQASNLCVLRKGPAEDFFSQERPGFAWSGVLALRLGDRVEVYKGVEELMAENG